MQWGNFSAWPDHALSSHVVPLGLAFDTGSGLPDQYRGGAFIGEHGSWDRPQFNGYKIIFVPFTSGQPSGKAQDMVTGFLDADSERSRPAGCSRVRQIWRVVDRR
jgi:glucose/arabinose dehydrogenase